MGLCDFLFGLWENGEKAIRNIPITLLYFVVKRLRQKIGDYKAELVSVNRTFQYEYKAETS